MRNKWENPKKTFGFELVLSKVGAEAMKELLSVQEKDFLSDVDSTKEYFRQFGKRMPAQLTEELNNLEKRLRKQD